MYFLYQFTGMPNILHFFSFLANQLKPINEKNAKPKRTISFTVCCNLVAKAKIIANSQSKLLYFGGQLTSNPGYPEAQPWQIFPCKVSLRLCRERCLKLTHSSQFCSQTEQACLQYIELHEGRVLGFNFFKVQLQMQHLAFIANLFRFSEFSKEEENRLFLYHIRSGRFSALAAFTADCHDTEQSLI